MALIDRRVVRYVLAAALLAFFSPAKAQTTQATPAVEPSIHLEGGTESSSGVSNLTDQQTSNVSAPEGSFDVLKTFEANLKAAVANDAYAQWEVGKATASGLGTEQNFDAAFSWLEKAQRGGAQGAAADLARFYEFGVATPADMRVAKELWQSATSGQDSNALIGFSDFQLRNDEKVQAIDVVTTLKTAADKESYWAPLLYGEAAISVEGFEKAGGLTLPFLQKSLDAGNPFAAAQVAKTMLAQKDAFATTDVMAVLDKGLAFGDPEAKAVLAQIRWNEGKNAEALSLFRNAAASGSGDAAIKLARFSLGQPNRESVSFAFATAASELGDSATKAEAKTIKQKICGEGTSDGCTDAALFFATEREASADNRNFLDKANASGEPVFGSAVVSIPKRPDSSSDGWVDHFVKMVFGNRASNNNKPLVEISKPEEDYKNTFQQMKGLLKNAKNHKILLYIHGYNTSFDDAATRLALLSQNLKNPGIPMLYSWPSSSTGLINLASSSKYFGIGYGNDEQSLQKSCRHFRDFLGKLVKEFGADNITILAHSMGARLVFNSLIGCEGDPGKWEPTSAPLGEIVLAAPDIDAEIFRHAAPNLASIAKRVTLYVSQFDAALALEAKILRGGRARAGQGGGDRIVLKDVDTIDASNVADQSKADGHAYVFEVAQVRTDMFQLLSIGLGPDDRQCPLKKADQKTGLPFWEFRPDC